jgi:nucleotide-binding universal stress UspA family protein
VAFKFKRILVPVSHDIASEEALRLACLIARQSKARLYVVNIIEVKRALPLDAEMATDLQEAEEVLKHAEDICADEDCEIETDLLQAREIADAIIEEAETREVDLIVLGTDYKVRFGFHHISDTIAKSFRNAKCRILLLQEPAPVKGQAK